MLFWSAIKPVVAAAAALAVVIGGAVVVGQVRSGSAPPKPHAAAVVPHDRSDVSDAIDLGDGVRVEFVAIAPADRDEWHTPAGAPADATLVRDLQDAVSGTQVIISPPATHRALVRVTAPPDASVRVNVRNSSSSGAVRGIDPNEGVQVYSLHFVVPANGQPADIEVAAAVGEWQTLAENEHVENKFECISGSEKGGIAFTEMIESDGKPAIYVATELNQQPWRVVAFDDGGNVLDTYAGGETSAGKLSTCKAVFNVERDRIRKLEVQTRPYNKFAACRNITLDPAHPTQPKIDKGS